MCSVDPDELVEMTRATGQLDLSSGDVMCRKCGTGIAEVVLRVKDAYCRDCFLSYFVHKFRSTIGKSKQIRHGDKVLVAVSGGASSASMLHLIRKGLDENSHKQLRFVPAFLYVDESCLSEDQDAGPEYIRQVCGDVTSLNFDCYVTSLQDIMSEQMNPPVLYTKEWRDEDLPNTKNLKEQVKDLLSSCKSTSAKQDLLEQLRQKAILQAAVALGYKKVFLADNATSLSIAILETVSIGRGSQLPGRVHFKSLHQDVEVYRPMREILENEINYYVQIHGLSTIQAPTFCGKGLSISSCTRDFVVGLQKDFPATIPTIFRTGDKLVSSSSDQSKCTTPEIGVGAHSGSELCVICGLEIDTNQGEASAVHAILVSQALSQQKFSGDSPNENQGGGEKVDSALDKQAAVNGCSASDSSTDVGDGLRECCGEGGCGSGNKANTKQQMVSRDQMNNYLCYGCRVIVRELSEIQLLPKKVLGTAAEHERRNMMRDQIQDFLL